MTTDTDRRNTWRDVLRQQGRSLTWLAGRTGVAPVTVYSYASGARRTPDAWLVKAAEALGVPVDLLSDQKAA